MLFCLYFILKEPNFKLSFLNLSNIFLIQLKKRLIKKSLNKEQIKNQLCFYQYTHYRKFFCYHYKYILQKCLKWGVCIQEITALLYTESKKKGYRNKTSKEQKTFKNSFLQNAKKIIFCNFHALLTNQLHLSYQQSNINLNLIYLEGRMHMLEGQLSCREATLAKQANQMETTLAKQATPANHLQQFHLCLQLVVRQNQFPARVALEQKQEPLNPLKSYSQILQQVFYILMLPITSQPFQFLGRGYQYIQVMQEQQKIIWNMQFQIYKSIIC
eukprot:TRINITY_DN12688_c0_g1_i11.p1 TRINITY_DN12688_c0_g1~~TRINITY_DN12688_c0_g1_i11.p1  ORF type:complete len:272 (-),score=-20.22 TRINITY_DN12688_c0_g1_i11:41-856(-)